MGNFPRRGNVSGDGSPNGPALSATTRCRSRGHRRIICSASWRQDCFAVGKHRRRAAPSATSQGCPRQNHRRTCLTHLTVVGRAAHLWGHADVPRLHTLVKPRARALGCNSGPSNPPCPRPPRHRTDDRHDHQAHDGTPSGLRDQALARGLRTKSCAAIGRVRRLHRGPAGRGRHPVPQAGRLIRDRG
jgi:hypothetical protein